MHHCQGGKGGMAGVIPLRGSSLLSDHPYHIHIEDSMDGRKQACQARSGHAESDSAA
jgi:hypothetical protein